MADLKSVKVTASLPFLGIEGTWEPDDAERNAAWEIYVELVTRVSIESPDQDEGLLREALSSLYSVFGSTRSILRAYGPSVAQPKGGGNLSLGRLSIKLLNNGLRPVLAKWHPLLLHHEASRGTNVSAPDHERTWDKHDELRGVLNDLRGEMGAYADLLAQVAGVPPLSEAVE